MTEYEEILSERVAELGDKFILQGDVYEAVKTNALNLCDGCVFKGRNLCTISPYCSTYDVIFIKEVV